MLSPGKVLTRRATRLGARFITIRQSSSSAISPQTSQSKYEQQELVPGAWESGKVKASRSHGRKQPDSVLAASTQAPGRLKEFREQEGHKQIPIHRSGLATGPLSYTKLGDSIVLRGQGSGDSITLDAAALRDGCQCATCKDPSSGQKSFASTEVPANITIANVRETPDGLGITFHNEIPRFTSSHETTVPWESIELALRARTATQMPLTPPLMNAVRARAGITLWDRATVSTRVRRIDYAEFMRPRSAAFWLVVLDLVRLGLVYLTGVPRDEGSVARIATRIASIRETFYGRTFDVRAKPDAENVAYTSGYLGLHQDLLYLDPPPRIQILHCLDNSCAGGESLFSDGERAARLLLLRGLEGLAAPLRDLPVPYAYARNGHSYAQRRPLLRCDDRDGAFENVFWSPPFQGGRDADAPPLKPWLRGARVFERLINSPAAVHRDKMRPGECVLFDNLRVMHGRTAFDSAGGGSRWLRGAYIAQEDFVSVATQIPAAVMTIDDGRGGEDGTGAAVWYDDHQEKLMAHKEWVAEAQDLMSEEA